MTVAVQGGTITGLSEYLAHVAGVMPQSFDSFVLEHGQPFTPHTNKTVFRGRMRECFKNAYKLVEKSNHALHYCEGMAWNIIPTLHAWCCDESGRVYEPTWKELGSEYHGIVFRWEYVNATILSRESYGIIDNPEDRFPLLRGAFDVATWKQPLKGKPHGTD